MKKIKEMFAVAGWSLGLVLLIILVVVAGFAIGALVVAGLVALWVQVFGHPEGFWSLFICVFVISTLASFVGALLKN